MNKKVFIVLLVLVIVFGFIIFGDFLYDKSYIIGKSNIKISERDVSLTVIDGTLNNTGATLELDNNSDKLLRYDEVYEIEIKVDGEWHKINVDQFFNMPLWGLEQNNKVDIEINWENAYGELDSGEYRVVKEVYFEGMGDQRFYIAAEFSI